MHMRRGEYMLEEVAKDAWEYGRKFLLQGKVADYIPELGKANPVHFGLCIKTEDGRHIEFGDSECRFTIQSICKIVSLAAALQYIGEEKVFKNVMMEPSGDAFNPMINAGAIEVVSLLAGRFSFEKMLEFIRTLCNDNEIVLDESVYRSEKATGDRNRAIGYLLKSKGVLKGDVLQTLDLYFKLCSLSVNARSLSELGLLLANGGISTTTGKRLLDKKVVRTLKTLMLTCGMYDRSGEFAVRVGIPSKSGVGGGILSCVGGRMGIGIYGPALDEKGNSIGGGYTLEYLSEHLNLHILDSADAKEA